MTRLYAFGIGASYSLLMFTLPLSDGLAPGLWAKCLTTASWVAGVAALSLARDLADRDTAQGLTGIARLRGFSARELERARLAAGAIKLSSTITIPGVMLAVAALLRFRTLASASVALALLLFTVGYAALFGGAVSALARACSRALPGRGRTLLLAVVLGPWLLAAGIDAHLPSVPAAFGWLLDRLAGLPR